MCIISASCTLRRRPTLRTSCSRRSTCERVPTAAPGECDVAASRPGDWMSRLESAESAARSPDSRLPSIPLASSCSPHPRARRGASGMRRVGLPARARPSLLVSTATCACGATGHSALPAHAASPPQAPQGRPASTCPQSATDAARTARPCPSRRPRERAQPSARVACLQQLLRQLQLLQAPHWRRRGRCPLHHAHLRTHARKSGPLCADPPAMHSERSRPAPAPLPTLRSRDRSAERISSSRQSNAVRSARGAGRCAGRGRPG